MPADNSPTPRLQDSKLLLTSYPLKWWEAETGRRLDEQRALAITPSGHYRGSPGIDVYLVYLALLDDGSQLTLAPAEFSKRFAWKNEPQPSPRPHRHWQGASGNEGLSIPKSETTDEGVHPTNLRVADGRRIEESLHTMNWRIVGRTKQPTAVPRKRVMQREKVLAVIQELPGDVDADSLTERGSSPIACRPTNLLQLVPNCGL